MAPRPPSPPKQKRNADAELRIKLAQYRRHNNRNASPNPPPGGNQQAATPFSNIDPNLVTRSPFSSNAQGFGQSQSFPPNNPSSQNGGQSLSFPSNNPSSQTGGQAPFASSSFNFSMPLTNFPANNPFANKPSLFSNMNGTGSNAQGGGSQGFTFPVQRPQQSAPQQPTSLPLPSAVLPPFSFGGAGQSPLAPPPGNMFGGLNGNAQTSTAPTNTFGSFNSQAVWTSQPSNFFGQNSSGQAGDGMQTSPDNSPNKGNQFNPNPFNFNVSNSQTPATSNASSGDLFGRASAPTQNTPMTTPPTSTPATAASSNLGDLFGRITRPEESSASAVTTTQSQSTPFPAASSFGGMFGRITRPDESSAAAATTTQAQSAPGSAASNSGGLSGRITRPEESSATAATNTQPQSAPGAAASNLGGIFGSSAAAPASQDSSNASGATTSNNPSPFGQATTSSLFQGNSAPTSTPKNFSFQPTSTSGASSNAPTFASTIPSGGQQNARPGSIWNPKTPISTSQNTGSATAASNPLKFGSTAPAFSGFAASNGRQEQPSTSTSVSLNPTSPANPTEPSSGRQAPKQGPVSASSLQQSATSTGNHPLPPSRPLFPASQFPSFSAAPPQSSPKPPIGLPSNENGFQIKGLATPKILTTQNATNTQSTSRPQGTAPLKPRARSHGLPAIPDNMDNDQRAQYDTGYRLRSLNESFKRKLAELDPGTTEIDTVVRAYADIRDTIGAPVGLYQKGLAGTKRKADDDGRSLSTGASIKKVKPGESISGPSSASATDPVVTNSGQNSATANFASGASVNAATTASASAPAPAVANSGQNNTTANFASGASVNAATTALSSAANNPIRPQLSGNNHPSSSNKRKATVEDELDHEAPAQSQKRARSNEREASDTSNLFKNTLRKVPSEESSTGGSSAPPINPFNPKPVAPVVANSGQNNTTTNFGGGTSVNAATTAQPNPTESSTSTGHTIFKPASSTSPPASATPAANSFVFKPTPAASSQGKSQSTTALQAPQFGSVASASAPNFLAQFGQKAASDMKKSFDEEKTKRKLEDYDSDEETEEQWEQRYEEEQRIKRQKTDALSKSGAKFLPGVGFIITDSEKPEENQPPPKPAEASQPSAPIAQSASLAPKSNQPVSELLSGASTGASKPQSAAAGASDFDRKPSFRAQPKNIFDPQTQKAHSEDGTSIGAGEEGSDSRSDSSHGLSSGDDRSSNGSYDDNEHRDPSYDPDEQPNGDPSDEDDMDEDEDDDIEAHMRRKVREEGSESMRDASDVDASDVDEPPTAPPANPGRDIFDRLEIGADGKPKRKLPPQQDKQNELQELLKGSKYASSFNTTPVGSRPITPNPNVFGSGANSPPNNVFGAPKTSAANPFGSQPPTTAGSPVTATNLATNNIFGPKPMTASPFGSGTNSLNRNPFSPNTSSPAGDHTWKVDSPLKFGGSSTAPTFNFTAASPPTQRNGTTDGSTQFKPPFSGLFGQKAPEVKPPTAPIFGGAGTNPSGVGFGFGGPPNNNPSASPFNLTPSVGNSALTSRASSPGMTDTGAEDSKAEDSQADEEVPQDAQVNLTAGGAGEEDEDILIELRVKAMKPVIQEDGSNQWTSQGVGPLRLLRNRHTGKARLLVRVDPSGNVVLNTTLQSRFHYQNPKPKVVQLSAIRHDGTGIDTWCIKVKADEDAVRLAALCEQNKS